MKTRTAHLFVPLVVLAFGAASFAGVPGTLVSQTHLATQQGVPVVGHAVGRSWQPEHSWNVAHPAFASTAVAHQVNDRSLPSLHHLAHLDLNLSAGANVLHWHRSALVG